MESAGIIRRYWFIFVILILIAILPFFNKKITFMLIVPSLKSNFISGVALIFLTIPVIYSAFILSENKRTLEYKQKTAQFLAKLFDEDPYNFLKENVYYTKAKGREDKNNQYSHEENRIYIPPKSGLGTWIEEFLHATRVRKGYTSLPPPPEEESIGQMVSDISSDYSYKTFYKTRNKRLPSIESYLRSGIEPYFSVGLKKLHKWHWYIRGHELASLYRRGKLNFEDIKRISRLKTDEIPKEISDILKKNERYISKNTKEGIDKINELSDLANKISNSPTFADLLKKSWNKPTR